jgi:rhodanese-related sulfurtransferase
MKSISPEQFVHYCKTHKTNLIDVRSPVEFRFVHAANAENIPLDQLDAKEIIGDLEEKKADKTIFLVGNEEQMSEMAGKKFIAQGFKDVVNVQGGMEALEDAGIAVERKKEAMSIDRQFRILAGILILGGVLLSQHDPSFVWLSGLVGVVILLSGLTNACAIGMFLAKMPWNRGG